MMDSGVQEAAGRMFCIIVVACLIVLVAMAIDLVSGLHKAKQRGEVRSSWGLKRTLSKFIMYEGGMLIAAGVDILLQLSQMLKLFGLEQLLGIPFVTCLLGVFLLIVEFLSVREKADEKTRTEMSRVEAMAAKYLTKDELVAVLTEVVTDALKKDIKQGEKRDGSID